MADPMADPIQVLVVDDDDDVRETLEIVLELSGFGVSSASNGQEALERLHASARPPIVLLDLRMPMMSGWEVIDVLREEGRLADVPIIICTSSPSESPPGFDVVPKPVDLQLLDSTIRRAAHERAGPDHAQDLPKKLRE
jgi:CheY-like chemotaxis protein